MRPLKLIMQAFGAFKDYVEIDFERLGQNNIYLISGVTGSGKTTIFDAICYSLFNNPSGSNRPTTSLKSHFANDETESFVDFSFLYKGEIYRIKRYPSFERKKAKKEGFITQSAKAELYLPNGKIIEKVKDVDNYIKELLNLDIDQFCQIALLAQGEFLKLLNCDTNQRGEIFRNIFKTFDYAKFQLVLKDKMLEYKKLYENTKNSILQYIKDITVDDEKINHLKENYCQNNCFDDLNQLIQLLDEYCKKDDLKLNSIKNEIEKINNEINQNRIEFEKIQNKINLENQINLLQAKLKQDESEFENLKKDYLNSQNKKEDLENLIVEFEKTNDQYKKSLLLKDLSRQKEFFENKKEEIFKRQKELQYNFLVYKYNIKKTSQNELLKLQNEFLTVQAQSKQASDEYEKNYSKYFSLQAGIIAQTLRENSPCPICGSLIHPNPAKLDKCEKNLTKELLDNQKEKSENLKTKMFELSKNCKVQKEKLDKISLDFDKLSKEYDIKIDEIEADDSPKSKYIVDFEKEIKENEKNHLEILNELNSIISKIELIRNDLKTTDIEAILNNHKKLEENIKNLKTQIETIENSYHKSNIEINSLKSNINLLLEEFKKLPENETNIDEILEKNKILEQKLLNLNHEIEKIMSTKSLNEKTLLSITKQNKEFIKIDEIYKNHKILSDCANGTLTGKIRLAFEQYIQGYYLDMVLFEANKRLKVMSKGQFELLRVKDSLNMQSKTGLELNVMDYHTFKQRSTKTLSGGESFMAALSLALGLSDCVSGFSRSVELDSLFIDEGFGTLDSESLDLAMDVIFNLTNNNKLIGIISHIEDLKSRIQNQITTIKSPNGSSVDINF